jgi:hypothetical protein
MVTDKCSVNIHRKESPEKEHDLQERISWERKQSFSPFQIYVTLAQRIKVRDRKNNLGLTRHSSQPHSLIGILGVQQGLKDKIKAEYVQL